MHQQALFLFSVKPAQSNQCLTVMQGLQPGEDAELEHEERDEMGDVPESGVEAPPPTAVKASLGERNLVH